MALAGGVVAVQPALNSGLGRSIGGLPAATLSFAVGALALMVLVAISGQVSSFGATAEVK